MSYPTDPASRTEAVAAIAAVSGMASPGRQQSVVLQYLAQDLAAADAETGNNPAAPTTPGYSKIVIRAQRYLNDPT